MASKIGRRGSNPGPGRTYIKNTGNGSNLGRTTRMKSSGGPNKDAAKAIARTPINQGRGGHQRP